MATLPPIWMKPGFHPPPKMYKLKFKMHFINRALNLFFPRWIEEGTSKIAALLFSLNFHWGWLTVMKQQLWACVLAEIVIKISNSS